MKKIILAVCVYLMLASVAAAAPKYYVDSNGVVHSQGMTASGPVSGTHLSGEGSGISGIALPGIDIAAYATVAEADTAAIAASRALTCTTTVTISTAVTITSPVEAHKGCVFTKSGSGTLAFSGPFESGLYQVFSGFSAGDVTFAANSTIIMRSWFETDATFDAAKSGFISIDANSNASFPESITVADASIFQNIKIGDGGIGGITDSIAIGRDGTVLDSVTTGYSLGAIGYEALKYNTTGYNNTAFGRSALRDNVDGINNTAVGVVSLESNVSGAGNTAVGVSSLITNTAGNNNTGLGFKAGYAVGGSGNTAVGTTALQYNTSGGYNTAVGYEALTSSTGSYNTAVGYDAGVNGTTGSHNTAVGKSSSFAIGTGNGNTSVGSSSLQGNANQNYNTAIGYEALIANTASSNTAVGRAALSNNTTFSNVVGIGANAQVSGSNQAQIGDGNVIIFGFGAHKITWSSAAPASGAWVQGDRAFNSTAAVGQPKGWVCTVSGTPGTWVSEGNL